MRYIFSLIALFSFYNVSGQCVLPGEAGTITGYPIVCPSQVGASFSISAINGATSYQWSYTGAGATFTDSSNSALINFSQLATSGILTVKGINACGAGSTSTSYNVTVNPSPASTDSIFGISVLCQGETSISYSVTGTNNTDFYLWNYTGTGASISNSTNAITIDFTSTATSGILTVTSNNTCGAGTPSPNFPITVNQVPQGSFLGNSICSGDIRNGQLNWVATAGTNPFTVIYNDGVANRTQSNLTSGLAFDSFSKPLSTTDYKLISVTSNNCSRNSGFLEDTATITVTTQTLSIISNSSDVSICAGSNASFSVSAVGAYSYQWHVSTDGGLNYSAILAPGNNPTYSNYATATLGLSGTSVANNGYKYKCSITASCGTNITGSVAALTVHLLPGAADTIQGPIKVCQQQNGVSFSVPAIPNAINYVWAYTGSGAALTVSSNTVTINFSTFSTSGNLTVKATSPFCTGTVSPDFFVSVTVSPTSAGIIKGTKAVCQNQTGVSYNIPQLHGSHSTYDQPTFTWAYSGTGATISGITNPMTIDFSDSATSGVLTVMRTQACGNGQISPNYTITVNPAPSLPTVIFDTTLFLIDPNVPQNSFTYSVNPIPGATEYLWTISGTEFTIVDNSTNSILLTPTTGYSTGDLTVQAGNGTCTGSISYKSHIFATLPIGIDEQSLAQNINLSPNPSTGIFNLTINNAGFNKLQITIYDVLGQEVFSISDKNNSKEYKKQVNLEDLPPGIYFVKLSTETETETIRISLQ